MPTLPKLLVQSLLLMGVVACSRPSVPNLSCDTRDPAVIQQVIDHQAQVLLEDSSNQAAYYELGMAYYTKAAFDTAIWVFDALIEKAPCYEGAYYNRGLIRWLQKDSIGACADWEAACMCNNPYEQSAAYLERFCSE